jgi:hypothetical protein
MRISETNDATVHAVKVYIYPTNILLRKVEIDFQQTLSSISFHFCKSERDMMIRDQIMHINIEKLDLYHGEYHITCSNRLFIFFLLIQLKLTNIPSDCQFRIILR